MKPTIYSIVFMLLPGIILAQADKVYTTSSGELIFSFARVDYPGTEEGSITRFSPFINIQNWLNYDKSEKLGFFTGLSVRNVGFIYDVDETTRKKYRTYNIGIPLGIKIGNLSEKFLFFGYELEIPVNYKEKTFINEERRQDEYLVFGACTNNQSFTNGRYSITIRSNLEIQILPD